MNTVTTADAASLAALSATLLQHNPEWDAGDARSAAESFLAGIDTSRPDIWSDLSRVLMRHHPELGQERATMAAWSMLWGFWQSQERTAAKAAR